MRSATHPPTPHCQSSVNHVNSLVGFLGGSKMLRRFELYLVLALFGSVATASAAVVNDVDIATGWTNGTGPVGGHFAVDTVGGIEIALRASLRTIGPITPVGNVYTAPVGTSGGLALWNFDFSINPGQLLNPVSRLTIRGRTDLRSLMRS